MMIDEAYHFQFLWDFGRVIREQAQHLHLFESTVEVGYFEIRILVWGGWILHEAVSGWISDMKSERLLRATKLEIEMERIRNI